MPTTRNTTSSTEPLAVPTGALALWEHGPRTTPTAHLTVQVSARGRREIPRRRAVLALASAYRVRARRAKLEEWRTGKNSFYLHEGEHPTQIDLDGEPADVARMAAALPGVLAAIEQAATAHVAVFGRWLRHSAEGQGCADPAQVPGMLRRWRAEFVPSLATCLSLGDAVHPGPVDPSRPWTYQDRQVAAAHIAEAGWDLAQWDDAEAAAAILAAATRHDMSIPAEEHGPALREPAEPVERESVWAKANRTRTARMQAAADAALAEYESAQATEHERQDAPEPRRADKPVPEGAAWDRDLHRRVWEKLGPIRLAIAEDVPPPPEGVPEPLGIVEPGVVAPGMYADLIQSHPWRTRARNSILGGVLVGIGPRASRIHARGRTYSVPNAELTLSTWHGPVGVALAELRTRDIERALDLTEVFRSWTVADHLEHAQRGRPARRQPARIHRPHAVEQPTLFEVESPTAPSPTPEEAGPLVVIPCSAVKGPAAAPARELYTGSYHRMCAAAAEALTTRGGRVLILSARHGLIEPAQVLEPYEHRMGQLGDVTPEQLRAQAERLGVADAEQVVILAGRAYAQAARAVWPHARTPLAGTRGIGHQRSRLAEIISTSSLPTTTHEATAA